MVGYRHTKKKTTNRTGIPSVRLSHFYTKKNLD